MAPGGADPGIATATPAAFSTGASDSGNLLRDSLVAQMVQHLPITWETRVQSLGPEDPLEKAMATHSSTLV